MSLLHDLDAFLVGMAVALFGEMIQIWAAAHLYKDSRFTTSGPYTYVRNPMYIGRFFLILGFFLMTANLALIAIYIVLFAAYAHVRVSREERRLKKIFGSDYEHYCSEIRRWLPRLKPYSRAETRRFSWARVCSNGEQLNLIGLLIILTLTYLRIEMLPPNLWNF